MCIFPDVPYFDDGYDPGWTDLAHNKKFLKAMLKIVEGLEKTTINFDEIEQAEFPKLP